MSTFGTSDDEADLARIRAALLTGSPTRREDSPQASPEVRTPSTAVSLASATDEDSSSNSQLETGDVATREIMPPSAEVSRHSFAGVRPRNRTPPLAPPSVATLEPEAAAHNEIDDANVDVSGSTGSADAGGVVYTEPVRTAPESQSVNVAQESVRLDAPVEIAEGDFCGVSATRKTDEPDAPSVEVDRWTPPPSVAPVYSTAAQVSEQLGISPEDLLRVLQQNPHLLDPQAAAAGDTAVNCIAQPVQDAVIATDTSLARSDLATAGWRAWLVKLGIPLRKGAGERFVDLMDSAHAVIRRDLNGSVVIGVTSYRGSCGKTSLTVLFGRLLAEIRGENVVALDTDLHGTLMSRALRGAPEPGGAGLTMSTLAGALRSSGVDVSRKVWDGGAGFYFVPGSRTHKSNTVTADEYRRVVEAVRQVNSIVLVDMSALSDNDLYQAVLESLDGLVMMSPTAEDGVHTLYETQSDLDRRHVGHLNQHRITVLNNITPVRSPVDTGEFARGLKHRDNRDVVEIPFDRHLAQSKEIDPAHLSPTTRTTFTLTLAAMIDTFDRRKTS